LFGIQRIFTTPIYFIINIIPVYIAGIIFYRKYINPYNKLQNNEENEDVSESVKKIFESQKFYNALSTVLPKGANDENEGLDYIPFMLHNLQDKRKRFQKSSSKFLVTTIVLSVFFVLTTILFSYIILNESSVGIYREVVKLNNQLNWMDQNVSALKKDMTENNYFISSHEAYFKDLQYPNKYLSNNDLDIGYKVKQAIADFKLSGNLDKLAYSLKNAQDSLGKNKTNLNEKYLQILNSTNISISDFKTFQKKTVKEISESRNDIKLIVPKIEKVLENPANSLNELIKRLILSIVVITFFLAILRYFKNLYQSHYSEMLKAEHQDLIIRKFYVTLKSSEGNPEERKIILSTFISDVKYTENEDFKEKTEKIETEVLRDIVNAILKKL
ncbi:hypothetical protein, partial [Chryseobacterium gambrini]|uniref:hypothetical protein n=1 Tax=Chryseobacterium gambrini TaxID=373672 RepID=UPI003BA6C604